MFVMSQQKDATMKTKRYLLTLPHDLHHRLKVYAAHEGITIQQAVIKTLEQLLTKEKL